MGISSASASRWKSRCVSLHDAALVGRPDGVEEVGPGRLTWISGRRPAALERDRHPEGLAAARAGAGEDGGGLAPELELERGRAGLNAGSAQASAIIMQAGPQVNSVVWWK